MNKQKGGDLTMQKKIIFGVLASLLTTGIALAAVNINARAQWTDYRSDLVRCQDITPNCGSGVTGTDPLASGRVTVVPGNITVRLTGALANTTYSLIFIPFSNTGANGLGPYNGGFITIGDVLTNRSGNRTVSFNSSAIPSPSMGYFLVNRANAFNEFATGFDPNPTPQPTIIPAS